MKYIKTFEGYQDDGDNGDGDGTDSSIHVDDDIAHIIDDSLIDLEDSGYRVNYGNYGNYDYGRCLFIEITLDKISGNFKDKIFPLIDLSDSFNMLINQLENKYTVVSYSYYSIKNRANFIKCDPDKRIQLPPIEDVYQVKLMFRKLK